MATTNGRDQRLPPDAFSRAPHLESHGIAADWRGSPASQTAARVHNVTGGAPLSSATNSPGPCSVFPTWGY